MDPQGQPVYSQARGFAAFQAAMEKWVKNRVSRNRYTCGAQEGTWMDLFFKAHYAYSISR